MSENLPTQTRHASEIPTQGTYTKSTARVSAARRAVIRHARAAVICDATILVFSAAIALFSRFSFASIGTREVAYASLSVGVSLTVLGFQGAYGLEGLQTLRAQHQAITRAAPVVFAAIAAVSYSSKDQFSRGYLLLFATIAYTSLLAGRWLVAAVTRRKSADSVILRRALIVGSADLEEAVLKFAQLQPIVRLPGLSGQDFEVWLQSLINQVNTHNIDVLVLSQTHDLEPRHIQRVSWVIEGSIDLIEQASLASLGRRAFLRTHRDVGFLHLVELDLMGPKRILKRLFDVTLSTLLLILLSPLLFITAIAIKLSSQGPILFVQPRIGQHGELFPFPKFRSMRQSAHLERQDILGLPDADMLTRYQSDPRITAVGRVIRRFSIDELPQLWSVLRGHMSIVGPRPILEEETQLLGDSDFRRHAAKPGLTGLWQVSGRKAVSWEERMRLDIAYIEGWTVLGDLALVLRTFHAVLSGKGAF